MRIKGAARHHSIVFGDLDHGCTASICHKASEKDEDQKEWMSNRSLSDCPCRAGEGIDGAL